MAGVAERIDRLTSTLITQFEAAVGLLQVCVLLHMRGLLAAQRGELTSCLG